MNGLAEKLNFSIIIAKTTTRLLSVKVANLSIPAVRLFKAVLSKALRALFFFSMDDSFSSEDDDHLFDLDYHPYARKRPLSSRLDRDEHDETDDEETNRQKLYLVPYRWWKETQRSVADQIGGILYTVLSNDNFADSQIVLELRKEESSGDRVKAEEGVSGRAYALVNEALWLQTLKWHNDSKASENDARNHIVAEDQSQEVFPLQIRLSFSPETNSLLVKISLKDNTVNLYRRACCIFSSESELLQIWDFSGQTSQFVMNEIINLPNISSGKPGKETLLELHVNGFFVTTTETNERSAELSRTENSLGKSQVKTNGSSDNLSLMLTDASPSGSGYRGIGLLGLTGLQNLGNTCFMNSAIQCLVHTPQLVDYFLGDYQKDINYENPLGMNGELALAFGELLRKLWAPGAVPVAPRMFKCKLAKFAPQFSGYNQHDSQEFLAFLLDGLHEDLNRVKCKPYIEAKDAEGCPDEEVADEYWRNHLARNDSIIVDVCQGQYRSTLVCPVCKKVSVTFDPFMYVTLPLPSTTMRTMTLTVFSTDGIMLPTPFTIAVPKCGRLKDLINTLSVACSLRNDETLLVAEIYKNQIFRLLDEPSDSLALIRDDDKLVAYRLPKVSETYPLVVFLHQQVERSYSFGVVASNWKPFGVPLVARIQDLSSGSEIRNQFLKLLCPFLMPVEDVVNDYDGNETGNTVNENSKMEDIVSPLVSDSDVGSDSGAENDFRLNTDFKFYLINKLEPLEIKMNKPVSISRFTKKFDVSVHWSDKMMEKYDTCLLSSLPEVFKPQLFTRRPQESISLNKCLEGFLQEEPLGPDDMWYCPRCKKPRQANKKLDLWRLPEILVIHLKRFSYSRFFKNKLETFVDFPIHDLNLSNYISHIDSQLSNCYQLYAISNHYGGMGGGHYTAFVDHGHGRWFEFDDDKVFAVSEDRIKSSAAYVLFYRRVREA
ncbi:PREDICTED: ubiquitin carboxyl-terminal hydrolase 8 isoform X1 [Theobroma cacao]|uniref:Ubiquitin carboxyl-terminal hydrolase n=2 Tax=Theobroma cacao TaxID=3641 RepID=A0AB32V2T8_THECC|nr:PREDICTED: ubiquitin carboxyl-terminal hydrolase 8 isoform X1 [Theobroma cacao]